MVIRQKQDSALRSRLKHCFNQCVNAHEYFFGKSMEFLEDQHYDGITDQELALVSLFS